MTTQNQILTIPYTLHAKRYKIYAKRCTLHANEFMQNKPNLKNAKMNLNFYPTTDYENKHICEGRKNKPNQTQFSLPFPTAVQHQLSVSSSLIGAGQFQTQRQGVLYGIFCYRGVLR